MRKGNYLLLETEYTPTYFYQVKPAETKHLHYILPVLY